MLINKIKSIMVWTLAFSIITVFPGITKADTIEETPFQVEQVDVQVLPEYSYHSEDQKRDEPPLLFGYHVTLKNTSDIAQKVQVEIPLPFEENNFRISGAGEYSSDEEIYEVDYEFDENTGILSWETQEEIEPQGIYKYVIEFYTNGIQKTENKKSLEYNFKSFADIGTVHLTFVEPLYTESFNLEPAPEKQQKNSMNINMFNYSFQAVKSGEEKVFHLEYLRDESKTTNALLDEMAESGSHPDIEAPNNEVQIPAWKIAILVGFFSIIAVVILIILLRKRSKALKADVENTEEKEPKEDVKKARIRSMLLEGSITEEEYKELIKKIGGKQQDD